MGWSMEAPPHPVDIGQSLSRKKDPNSTNAEAEKEETADESIELTERGAFQILQTKWSAVETKAAKKDGASRQSKAVHPGTAKLVARLPPVRQTAKETVRRLLGMYNEDRRPSKGPGPGPGPGREGDAARSRSSKSKGPQLDWSVPFSRSVDLLTIQ